MTVRHTSIQRAARQWFVSLLACGGTAALCAALPPGSFDTYESRSQQFVVTGVKPGTFIGLPSQGVRPSTDYMLLETGVVAVNCDRIKEALLRELGLADQWQSKIKVRLMPDVLPDTPITVHKEKFTDRWQFTLYSPHYVEPVRFVRGIVWSLLLEMANRNNNTTAAAEIPLWLVEGLTTHLVAAGGASIIMPPRSATLLSARAPDVFASARARFKQQSPVSFSDLSMPSAAQVSGAAWEDYRCSAHVFVAQLMNFKDGRACMVETIRQLPNFLNPQLAFLQAWRGHFHTVLDVEKWWSAALVNFTGRDQHLRWSQSASLQRLDELLRATVEVRTGTNALPRRAEVPLQRLLEQTEFANHRVAIANLAQQLQILQWNAPSDLSKLVIDYRTVLVAYLQKREKAAADAKGQSAPAHKVILREATQQLDLLDVIRGDFRKFDLAEAEGSSAK